MIINVHINVGSYANEFSSHRSYRIALLHFLPLIGVNWCTLSPSVLCALPPTVIDNRRVAKLLCFWWTVTRQGIVVVAAGGLAVSL